MKKLIFLTLIIAIVVLSCGSTDGEKAEAGNTENKEVKASSTTSQVGKTINLTKAMFLDQIMNYEENSTEWVYKGDKPGLIDFYADWCGPCKITSPIMDELAAEYAGKVNIYKVNVDKEKELAAVFGVRSIPTFLFMPMEGQPSLSSGIARSPQETKQMFKQQIEQILLKEAEM